MGSCGGRLVVDISPRDLVVLSIYAAKLGVSREEALLIALSQAISDPPQPLPKTPPVPVVQPCPQTVGDALVAIGASVGVTRPEINQIFEDVKTNFKILDACSSPHDFKPLEEPGQTIVRDYRCSKCSGKLAAGEARWYAKGLEDSKSRFALLEVDR